MLPAIGERAPDFVLFNQEKKEVRLSQMSGRNVVLLFFPFAFTNTCTAELCHVRDNLNLFSAGNATVFGISVDAPFSLKKFREEQKLPYDLLSDFNREASTAFHCIYENFGNLKNVSKRAAFVIDREGILRYSEVLENASLQPDYEKIVACLNSLT